MLPIGTAFEASLNCVMLQEKEKDSYFWEADYSDLLKSSMIDRFNAYKQAKDTGWITINEIRKLENFEAIEGMDVLNVGLGAALYNVETGEYYVPNTDTAKNRADKTNIEEGSEESE